MKKLSRKIQKGIEIYQANGLGGVYRKVAGLQANRKSSSEYQKRIAEEEKKLETNRSKFTAECQNFPIKPLISILLPVYNVDEKWLRLCLDSVLKQIYQNWELCIADDCSTFPHIRKTLEEYSAKDKRIKVVYRTENGHISAASNSAIELASGEFCALLDNDDEIAETALYFVVREINSFPEVSLIFSDEDMIDKSGFRYSPNLKPGWNQELFYSLNLINHLGVYKTDLLREIGGFRCGFEGSQDYDLALRFIERIKPLQIRHIPEILYHWRSIEGSVANGSEEKPYAHERARIALREHFTRIGEKIEVTRGYSQYHQVSAEIPTDAKVSVFSTKGFSTKFENVEFKQVKVASADEFNESAKESIGDVFIFLRHGIYPDSDESFSLLLEQVFRRGVGAVGAKVIDSKGFIRHCGIDRDNKNGIKLNFHKERKETESGLFRAQVTGSFIAAADVLAIRRSVFMEINGFDAANFNETLFDVDICLRLKEKDLQTVIDPNAVFVADRKSEAEKLFSARESPAMKEILKKLVNLK